MTTEVATSRKVLFLAYLFPPVGGSGVQRSVKFVKYLPQHGWLPTVLTVKPISYYVYDATFLRELPANLTIVRSGSLDPLRISAILLGDAKRSDSSKRVQHPVYSTGGKLVRIYRKIRAYLMFPDAHLGWIPFAYWRGLDVIRREKPDVIYTPAVPFSSTLAAWLLSKRTGLPFIVDFRDGWTDDEYLPIPTPLHRWGHKVLERLVVTSAAGIAVYGRWLGDQLTRRYPEISGRVREITNGFDPADLTDVAPADRTPGRHRVVYSGSLYPHHRPVFGVFLSAVAALPRTIRNRLEIVFIGQAFEEAMSDVARADLDGVVTFLGYQPHNTALSYLRSADATLLLVRSGDIASVTGKVFELLMSRRPIIAVAEPAGEAARILKMAQADSWLVKPDDTAGLTRVLTSLIHSGFPSPPTASVDRFSRVEQAGLLADLLATAVNERRLRETR